MVIPTSVSSLIPFMLVVAPAVYAAQPYADGKTCEELDAEAEAMHYHPMGSPPDNCTCGFFTVPSGLPGSTKSYYFIREISQFQWAEAKQMCEDRQLQLAEPHDPVPIREWITENCGNRYTVTWLGARGNGSSLIWQHRGEAIDNSSSYFGSDELYQTPATSKDDCLKLESYLYPFGITYLTMGCSSNTWRYGSAVCEVPETTSKNCEDKSNKCPKWATQGKCSNGNIYFKCKSSCACGTNSIPCTDRSNKCPKWANQGKCNKKKVFNKCKSSCACGSDTA